MKSSLSDFGYRPASLSFVAGSTVKITLINDGSVTHEFMAGRVRAVGGGYDNDLLAVVLAGADGSGFSTAGVELGTDDHAADEMTDDHEAEMGVMDDGEHAGHSGAAVSVEPGGRVELELFIPTDVNGNWGFGCFIKGHYEAGMHGTMTVVATNA